MNTPEETIEYLNTFTGRKYRMIKSNLNKVKTLIKEGYTYQDIKEVIEIKTYEWLNNPKMSQYLNPTTLFRLSNFDKYVNQVIAVKENKEQYKKYYEEINRKTSTSGSASSAVDDMFA